MDRRVLALSLLAACALCVRADVLSSSTQAIALSHPEAPPLRTSPRKIASAPYASADEYQRFQYFKEAIGSAWFGITSSWKRLVDGNAAQLSYAREATQVFAENWHRFSSEQEREELLAKLLSRHPQLLQENTQLLDAIFASGSSNFINTALQAQPEENRQQFAQAIAQQLRMRYQATSIFTRSSDQEEITELFEPCISSLSPQERIQLLCEACDKVNIGLFDRLFEPVEEAVFNRQSWIDGKKQPMNEATVSAITQLGQSVHGRTLVEHALCCKNVHVLRKFAHLHAEAATDPVLSNNKRLLRKLSAQRAARCLNDQEEVYDISPSVLLAFKQILKLEQGVQCIMEQRSKALKPGAKPGSPSKAG